MGIAVGPGVACDASTDTGCVADVPAARADRFTTGSDGTVLAEADTILADKGRAVAAAADFTGALTAAEIGRVDLTGLTAEAVAVRACKADDDATGGTDADAAAGTVVLPLA